MKVHYVKDTKRFWETRKKSREAVDKALSNRPFVEKLGIMDEMNANHMAVRNAKKIGCWGDRA